MAGNRKASPYCCGILFSTCLLTSVLLLVLAILIIVLGDNLIQEAVNQKVTVVPGHTTYKQFVNPSVPLWKSVHFFNLTNPEEFEAGEKPVLEEIGPYSYRENRTKNITEVSADKKLLNYTQQKTFLFDANNSMSGAQETDVICTVNLPLVGAVAEVMRITDATLRFAGMAILEGIFKDADAHLYTCQQATPLVWNYTDDLIERLHTNFFLVLAGMNYPRSYVSIQLNNSINDSLPSAIYTGVGNITDIGKFVKWDGHVGELDTWPNGMGANDINGTEGFFFRPNQAEKETLEVFVDDVLRTFQMVYVGKVKHLGLEAYRYELPNSTFESAFNNSENARWGSWCPDGMIYLGPTQYPEVPVFGSKPHFLDGSPSLREAVTGLNPDPSRNRSAYDTTLDVHPVIGVNIQFQRALQINVLLNHSEYFSQLENIDGPLYYPMLYVNEHSQFTPEVKTLLQKSGLTEISIVEKMRWIAVALLLIGCITCFLVSLLACRKFVKSRESSDATTPLLKNAKH